jgi:hypothetical protein
MFSVPLLAAGIALGAILIRITGVSFEAVVLGLLLFGYLVGNRGFAQLMPMSHVPLLPAELGLMITGGWLVVRSAFDRRLPLRPDSLNWAVLAWLVLGTARVVFDLRPYGLMALRDYAMIYYAAFFFIAQRMAGDAGTRRFFLFILVAASVAQPVALTVVELFPGFVMTMLAVKGVPLIYFKGDLAATFLAVSAIILFHASPPAHRYWMRPLATIIFVYVLTGQNRASMIGAGVALLLIACSRHRLFAVVQVYTLVALLLAVAALAWLAHSPWAEGKLQGASERMVSLVDVTGRGTYASTESSMKGDNNRFRWVWWRTVAHETMEKNPLFGLGFGYDLARGFLHEYNPQMAEDFTARSPHSIVVSALGRLGLAGLACFAWIGIVVARKTWRALRDPAFDIVDLSYWICGWVILASACFGVVLEGPMGAMVFWTLVGLAHGAPVHDQAANRRGADGSPCLDDTREEATRALPNAVGAS